MSMKYCSAAMLAASLVFTVGCKPDGQPPAASQDAVSGPVSAQQASPASLAQTSNGMLTVEPATVDLCKETDGVMASKVSWDATAAGTEGVEVWLQSPGEAKKLWSAAGAVSSAETGRWLREGSLVILVNGESSKELAKVQIASRACNR